MDWMIIIIYPNGDSPKGERLAKRVKTSNSNLHCRFLFPKKVQHLRVDDKTGAITLPRNHPWVNKGNKILSCALRSNHDISFIGNSSRMLASVTS
jgi:hypothetical protein